MLVVSNLSKKYGKVWANDDISFSLASGEVGVLLGPNGAGKSTAIKSIAGLLRYDGEISIDEHHNKTEAAKRQMGYVPEFPAPYDMLTVDEHVEFIIRAYKLPAKTLEYADQLLEAFELLDKRKKLGKELSKGMQQKISIICALLPRPKLLMMDEPLVGLDPHAIKALKRIINAEKERGSAVLISTHMIDSVEGMWDTAYIMVNGKIAATRERGAATNGQSLESLFFDITEAAK